VVVDEEVSLVFLFLMAFSLGGCRGVVDETAWYPNPEFPPSGCEPAPVDGPTPASDALRFLMAIGMGCCGCGGWEEWSGSWLLVMVDMTFGGSRGETRRNGGEVNEGAPGSSLTGLRRETDA